MQAFGVGTQIVTGWAVYIETPGLSYERHPMYGFIAHLDYNLYSRDTDLQLALFLEGKAEPKMLAIPFGTGTILDAMARVDQVDDMFMSPHHPNRYIGGREEYKVTLTAMLQLLLYLCSEEPDLPEIEHPQKRRTLFGRVRRPEEPRVWDVGFGSPTSSGGSETEKSRTDPPAMVSRDHTPARAHMYDRHIGTPTGQVPGTRSSRKESRS